MDQNIEDLFGMLYLSKTIYTKDILSNLRNYLNYYEYFIEQPKKIKTALILDKLQEMSICMMNYRNQFLEQEEYQKAREIHHILARIYRYFARLVASQDREIFLILSDYWRRGGESFWKPSSLRLKEMLPSKTKEEDNKILITEYEDIEKIEITKEEEANAERETKINIQKEKDNTASSGRTIFKICLNKA